MDRSDLIGVWRLLDVTCDGRAIRSGQTHLVVHEERLWQVWPDNIYYEGEPGPEREYELESGWPARLEVLVPRGRFCYLLVRDGDALRARLGGVFGRFAKSIDDERGNLYRYTLETDEALVSKLSAPVTRATRLTTTHAALGKLVYDDNLDWWSGTAEFGARSIRIQVTVPPDDSQHAAFAAAASALATLDCTSLKRYAAGQLLALHNESWRDEDEDATADEFVGRMSPESLSFSPRGVTAYFGDGNLFYGHSICVQLDSDLQPRGADIAG